MVEIVWEQREKMRSVVEECGVYGTRAPGFCVDAVGLMRFDSRVPNFPVIRLSATLTLTAGQQLLRKC